MNNLFERIHSYDIFNCLYPGLLFCIFCDPNTQLKVIQLYDRSIVLAVVFCYAIGLFFDRLGALIVENFSRLVITHVLCSNFYIRNYEDFVKAKKSDKEIEILSEKNNLYRNMVALFLGIIIDNKFNGSEDSLEYIFYGLISIIFWISYFRQRKYIVKRIDLIMNGTL